MARPTSCPIFFFFNDTATTEIYTLSLHDALPIFTENEAGREKDRRIVVDMLKDFVDDTSFQHIHDDRSEEHTSELQSRPHLVCRLLLEKKKITSAISAGMMTFSIQGGNSAAEKLN